MQHGRGENGIVLNFKTKEVLDKLIANRDQHVEDFEDALVEWKKDQVASIVSALEVFESTGKLPSTIKLSKPESYAGHYDAAITMFEMTCDEEVELASADFDKFINNNWEWRHSFANNTMSYLNK